MASRHRICFVTALALGGGLFLTLLLALRPRTEANAAPSSPPSPRGDASSDTVVLLELFTSEGCSSCPPADSVVRQLARAQSVAGTRIVVLAHHVDYWNELGWPDPFSSPTATLRQRAYAPLGGGGYTPQAVVDGRAQMAGSQLAALVRAIEAAAKRPHSEIAIEVVAPPPARGVFDLTIRVGPLQEAASDGELVVAVVQDQARVAVGRGENAGRSLEHIAIARAVNHIATIGAGGGVARTGIHLPAAIGAPPGSYASSFSVVAFVQERATRRVLGSAAAALTAPSM